MFDLEKYHFKEAAITSSVVSLGISAYKISEAEKQKKDAKNAINDFKRQDLVNSYENIQLATLQADQQTEANTSNMASSIDVLQRGGTRAVIGGIPRVNEQNILLQNIISQDLQRQDAERSQLIAKGESDIMAIREGRESNALLGLGQQLQTARQDSASGIASAFSSVLSLGDAIMSKKDGEDGGDDIGVGKGAPIATDIRRAEVSANSTNANPNTYVDPRNPFVTDPLNNQLLLDPRNPFFIRNS